MANILNLIYLSLVEPQLNRIFRELKHMSAALDRLTQDVAENGSAIDSAIELINGLAQQIRDNVNDPAALTALADELDAQDAKLAAAVQANVPPAAAPPVE